MSKGKGYFLNFISDIYIYFLYSLFFIFLDNSLTGLYFILTAMVLSLVYFSLDNGF